MRTDQGGSERGQCAGATPAALVLMIAGAVFACVAGKAQAAEDCAPVLARIVSIQGAVELRRSRGADWQTAGPASALCAGDRIRVRERGRAALLLANESTLRLDQNTTLTLAAPEDEKASLMELLSGVLHVITRTPRPFKVKTPFVNAGVEGTEFLVGVGEQSARVAVYEGRVSAANDLGTLSLIAGELALVASNQAPRKERMVRPVDAVQWALYYPNVIDYGLDERLRGSAAEAALRESVELYRQGRLAEAIYRTDNAPEGRDDPRFLTYRAGLLLLVGRVDEAMPEIERALAADARNSDAHALQAIIAVAQNEKDQALKLATRAVELDPASPAARMALSYAQQARFKIEEAQASVRKAVELNPKSALAWARLAELQMSTGDLDGALASAQHAVEINPQFAKTQMVLGFAHLTRFDTKAAKLAFEQAIALDQAEPVARLGLGLAKIRDGDLTAGREDIEIAVSLDPGNALLRSYMGKAYYEEKRDRLAGAQFDLAKAYDSRDPTPWFYDAIRKQTDNRPVEALEDLQRSIELNDNRAVYRSRLLLDQDLAARSASLARIYADLDFGVLGLAEAARSLSQYPQDPSAHRFLADMYATLPRHDIARVSELLQAQLRQPVSIVPVEPDLADDTGNPVKAGLLRGIRVGSTGLNEYTSLFERESLAATAQALVANHETVGDQLVLSGLREKLSWSIGQLHFETDGLKPSTAFRRDVYNAFVQASPSQSLSLQAEFRYLDSKRDEIFFDFDPDAVTTDQIRERVRNARIGARYSAAPESELLLSAIWQEREVDTSAVDLPQTRTLNSRGLTGEIQYNRVIGPLNVTAGAGRFDGRNDFVAAGFKNDLTHDNAYVYGTFTERRLPLQAVVGLATDSLKIDDSVRRRMSPKFGLVWSVTPSTTLRAAVFRSFKRQFIGNQTIEPTQVAGFNQFFDDPGGTAAWRKALAIDQRLSKDVYAGAEATRRTLDIPVVGSDFTFRWREWTHRGYAYWAVPPESTRGVLGEWNIALGAEADYEKLDREVSFGLEGIRSLRTWTLPIGFKLFHGKGISVGLTVTGVDQRGDLEAVNSVETRARFAVTDVAVAYRLPRRQGQVGFGIRNLADRRFNFVDSDLLNPRFAAQRFVYGKLVLAF